MAEANSNKRGRTDVGSNVDIDEIKDVVSQLARQIGQQFTETRNLIANQQVTINAMQEKINMPGVIQGTIANVAGTRGRAYQIIISLYSLVYELFYELPIT